MKHKSSLCAHGGIHQWGVNYWGTYDPVVYCIIMSTLLDIKSIHEFTSRFIDFVLLFPQADLDVDVFVGLPLEMGVYGNIG